MTLRIVLTPGEPAGIGPDLSVQLAQQALPVELVAVADPELLAQRAAQLGLPLHLEPVDWTQAPQPASAGCLRFAPVPLQAPVQAGVLNPANAAYVLETLRVAAQACLTGQAAALVTGPVHKGVINAAGVKFSGHTEFLAEFCHTDDVVMLLATPGLRVALATTHLPLAAVSAALTPELLMRVLRVLHRDLQRRFGLPQPRIAVCGLNPHAGEGGHLGREEIDVMLPVLTQLRQEGMHLLGPLPADTAFTPQQLAVCDVVLTMYHDQGLPVLKHLGFGQAINISLGLPLIRTSVDHGTALDLAGTGRADGGSLQAALRLAIELAQAPRG